MQLPHAAENAFISGMESKRAGALNVEEVDFVEVLIMGWIAPQLDNGGHKSGHKTL